MAKNPLILDPMLGNTEKLDELKVDTKKVEKAVEEVDKDIPIGYIEIKLPSNGRIEGIPSSLHFRDYTGNDALDLNVLDENERVKTLVNVLKRMCYEQFDIGLLPVEDVLYILYVLQFTFISSSVEKYIYVDENLPEGEDEGQKDSDENLELVEIPFSALHVTFLGKDKDDKDLPEKVKFPLTLTDNTTNSKVRIKLPSLKDALVADKYCKEFYHDKTIEFNDIRRSLSQIEGIKKKSLRDEKMDEFTAKNEDRLNEYYSFLKEYALMVAKFMQSLQIVAFNGEVIEDAEKKWELYNKSISTNLWNYYNSIVEKFKFGLNEEVEVFSKKLKTKVSRRVSFQLFEFISFDRTKTDDRFSVSFD